MYKMTTDEKLKEVRRDNDIIPFRAFLNCVLLFPDEEGNAVGNQLYDSYEQILFSLNTPG